jgi:hypothetical protein
MHWCFGSDLALPEVEGRRSVAVRLTNLHTARVLAAAESNPFVVERFLRVVHLVDPPTRLMHPAVLFRVAWPALGRRRPAPPSPGSGGVLTVAPLRLAPTGSGNTG